MIPYEKLTFDVGQSVRSSNGIYYECIQRLGVGGNAATFLVAANQGPQKGVLFALKVFRKLSAPERQDAFIREVAFLIGCQHQAVMRVFDVGMYEWEVAGVLRQYPFVIAEYLPRTLAQAIASRDLTIPEKLTYAIQLLSAVSYLAAMSPPTVHRDIKPQNIFLKGHSCVLGDFGLLKRLDGSSDADREVLKESAGVGMPFYYRTPDLVAYANGTAPLTSKTDVFQLGLVLAHLFSGWNPAEASEDMLAPVKLTALASIPSDFGVRIRSLISRMLVLDPAAREDAATLMDHWRGVFRDAVLLAHRLDGRAF